MHSPPVVWTIAGFDPSSGAGATADLKTISALGCYGAACITALTVQNTIGVRRVEAVAPELVGDTLQVLLEDLPPSAIKIGMLATEAVAAAIADFLSRLPGSLIVLDPILRSSSGAVLLDEGGERILKDKLLPLAAVITPNRAEAERLTGRAGAEQEELAAELLRLGAAAAVVTGGDAEAEIAADAFAYTLGSQLFVETLSAPRIVSSSTHGTGCAFSTAIACGLALGESLPAAVTSAKSFVRRAIQCAPGIGHGKGPMGLERAGSL
jgi:hydroxymethylpyrimidine/phosphomethylpyrimidine kinase